MKIQFKITALKKAETELIGKYIPTEYSEEKYGDGYAGKYVEDVFGKLGYPLNTRKGVDIEDLGVEIKTARIDPPSDRTIGSMTINDIINTSYEDSAIYKKLQQQFVVKWIKKTRQITEARMWDFRSNEIQDKFRIAYETTREKLISYNKTKIPSPRFSVRDGRPTHINRSDVHYPSKIESDVSKTGYWEHTESGNFKFRIPYTEIKTIEHISKTLHANSEIFDTPPATTHKRRRRSKSQPLNLFFKI